MAQGAAWGAVMSGVPEKTEAWSPASGAQGDRVWGATSGERARA